MSATSEAMADVRAYQQRKQAKTYSEIFSELAEVVGMIRDKLHSGRATHVAGDLADMQDCLLAMSRAAK